MSAQLWIADFLQAFQTQEDIDKSEFKAITVLGTVVNVPFKPFIDGEEVSKKPVVYEIDDGTGIVKVVHFLHDKMNRQREYDDLQEDDSLLSKKFNNHCLMQILEVGTTIHVKGVPQMYNNRTEVKAYCVRRVCDPNQEVERMFLVDNLRKSQLYSSLLSS